MFTTRFVPSLICFLAFFASGASSANTEEYWQNLRKVIPYHYQGIAVSADRTIVVVMEPPSAIRADDIARILDVSDSHVMKHRLGFDGWASDLVCTFHKPPTQQELNERIALLASRLYGTSYGADYITLPESPLPNQSPDLDVVVGADDLNRWLLKDNTSFESPMGGKTVSARELATTSTSGVYWSNPRGLVVWSVPRGAELQEYQVECRQWTIDSDLVLGALSGPKSVLIVGRLRQADLTVLPPLRTEEILRLAAVRDEELGQSYERNHILAGRWDSDEYRDWAPIYLSAALLDTEYGSLLNITDQLLKSWSQHGNISYFGFDYDTPPLPFNGPITDLLPGDTLTFNWNTLGVGHVVNFDDDIAILGLNRTGALPVSYIPDGLDETQADDGTLATQVATYEERAYSHFSELNNVHFVRVVQYAALYQIFREFGVHSRVPVLEKIPSQGDAVFRDVIDRAFARLTSATVEELDDLTKRFGEYMVRLLHVEEDKEAVATQLEVASFQASLELRSFLEELYGNFDEKEVRARLTSFLLNGALDDEDRLLLSYIAKRMEDVESEEALSAVFESLPKEQSLLFQTFVIARILQSPDGEFLQSFLKYLADGNKAKDLYAQAFQSAREPNWIRTPSIVLSYDTTNADAIGGHNIDSTIGAIVADASVAKGKPVVTAVDGRANSMRVHPDDMVGVGRTWRQVARSEDPASNAAAILRTVKTEMAGLPKSFPDRLKIGAETPKVAAGAGGSGTPPPTNRFLVGAAPAEGPRGPVAGEFNMRSVVTIDKERRVTADGKHYYEASTTAAMTDQILMCIRRQSSVERNTFEISIARGTLEDGEVRALAETLRARTPKNVNIVIKRGAGSPLIDMNLSDARVANVVESAAKLNEPKTQHVYEIEIRPAPVKESFKVRAFSNRVLVGLKQMFESAFSKQSSKAAGDPTTPRNLRLKLQEIPELNDVEFRIEIPGESALDDFLVTEALPVTETSKTYVPAA